MIISKTIIIIIITFNKLIMFYKENKYKKILLLLNLYNKLINYFSTISPNLWILWINIKYNKLGSHIFKLMIIIKTKLKYKNYKNN